jgi:predicted deacylase
MKPPRSVVVKRGDRAVETMRISLPAAAPGTERHLVVQRFGAAGARPKAYLQAALHADELPGTLVLHALGRRLTALEEAQRITGEILLVPVANPIGLAQSLMQTTLGRYDLAAMSNFNRAWPDLEPAVAAAVATRLGEEPARNVALVRAALRDAAAALPAVGENAALRRSLCRLAVDADIVLDLHCDLEAALHLYLGTPLWPEAADLAAETGAVAVLLAEESGGHPFDEAFSSIWWRLARRFPARPLPQACLAATLEYRGQRDLAPELAAADAEALLRFLTRRGVLAGELPPLPPLATAPTPLEGAAMIEAPVSGLALFAVAPGDAVAAGQLVCRLLDPLRGEAVEVRSPTAGRVFARALPGLLRAGEVVAKVAGAVPLPGRRGALLPN